MSHLSEIRTLARFYDCICYLQKEDKITMEFLESSQHSPYGNPQDAHGYTSTQLRSLWSSLSEFRTHARLFYDCLCYPQKK